MNVCANCFNDYELKRFIVSNSSEKGKCDYCGDSCLTDLIDVDELLDFFAEFIKIYKIDEYGVHLFDIIQNDWNLFSDKQDNYRFIADILSKIDNEIKYPTDKVSYVEEINECVSYWEVLKEDIKWKKRFLPDIDKLIDELGWDSYFTRTITLPQDKPLYRARLHYSGDQKEYKIADMGCPERTKATAGRANPQGIPYLYLSQSTETTLYEIRAAFLDEVSVGTFKIKRDVSIVLVDFTEPPAAFLNIGEIIQYTKSMFLRKVISSDLSLPLRRFDSEIEYIPTQFICEFIKHFTGGDGIIFNSSLHTGGKNIVLFEQDKIECVSVCLHRVKPAP